MGDVARIGAERRAKPTQRKNGKGRSNSLMKKLAQRPPQPPECSLRLCGSWYPCRARHSSILAQNRSQSEVADRKQRPFCSGNLHKSTVDRLETTERSSLESLRIQVDQESFLEENDKKPAPRLTMTPQDVRFLKSLRIATDDVE